MNPIPAISHGLRTTDRPRTCNQAAACLFPEATKIIQAFIELEEVNVTHAPQLQIMDLLDDFWAASLDHVVFVQPENQFRQYNPTTGIYTPVTESTLIGQVITNLNLCGQLFPQRLKLDSFLSLKNRQRLKSVIERARDLRAVDESFFEVQSPYQINVANGILNLVSRKLTAFSPDIPIRQTLSVRFDPDAHCDLFLQSFLHQILSPEDVDLLQRFFSQILGGINHAQKILVLTGESGWGKSSLMKIMGAMLGWNRVGIIRDQLYKDPSEISHYAGKHLLYAPDMHSQFLNRKEASVFKQLVGGDPLWAETKAGDERMIIEGRFPIVVACNGKPQILIDQDIEAWSRRLVVLSFKKPADEKHLGRLAEVLLQKELSGILNWLLEGYGQLHKASLQLTLTSEQQTRAALMLMQSDSPAAFVRGALIKKSGSALGAGDLYERYQSWCRQHQVQPFSSRDFSQTARAQIEIRHGLRYRHDLANDIGGCMRGWKGLALIEADAVENASRESGEPVVTELAA